MVHKHVSNDDTLDPAYAGRSSRTPIPKNRLPEGETAGRGRVPADPRRADARRQLAAEPGDVRDDVDGAAGRRS